MRWHTKHTPQLSFTTVGCIYRRGIPFGTGEENLLGFQGLFN
jgi:hypothetical protein